MPTPSTQQSQMDTHLGMVPGLDANGVIDDISYMRNVVAKTADYTVKASETGTLFTTVGATGGVNFTLPTNVAGLEFWFMAAEDLELMVTSDAVDTLVSFNDKAADTVAFTTASEHIGSGFIVIADGTLWHVFTLASNGGSIAASLTITS